MHLNNNNDDNNIKIIIMYPILLLCLYGCNNEILLLYSNKDKKCTYNI